MNQDSKRHALTRVGETFNRRVYYRRDANCPATMIYRREADNRFARKHCWISNISEGGVLLLTEGIPDRIEELYVLLPGLIAKVSGKIVRHGDLTAAIEFDQILPTRLVDWIARLEPRRKEA